MLMFIFIMLGLIISLIKNGVSIIGTIFVLITCFFMLLLKVKVNLGNYEDIYYFFGTDQLSWLMVSMSFWLFILIVMVSINSLNNYGGQSYFFFIMMLLIVLLLSFFSLNLLYFYFFFEFSLVPIFIMIMGWGYQPERIKAGMYMLFYTVTASMPLLLVIVYYYNINGSFFMLNMGSGMNNNYFYFSLFLAFMLKLPVFMFHLWLPKAHVEAPVGGSMVLAGVLLKLGGYGIFRFLFLFENFFMKGYFISLGIIGGFLTGVICLGQYDMKSLVAYSSIGHMGLVLGGLFSYLNFGVSGSVIMMIGHGFCSSGLFCLVGMFYDRYSSRSMLVMKGLLSCYSSLVMLWFILCIVNMSCPPSINLVSEIFVFVSLLGWSVYSFIGLSILSFICAIYSLYMFSFSSHGISYPMYSVYGVTVKEYILGFLHLVPLFFFIMKCDLFSY